MASHGCTNPRKNWIIGYDNVNLKPIYKYTGHKCDHVEKVAGVWRACNSQVVSLYASDVSYEFVEVPCGQCINCRLAYSRQWANRCMLELEDHNKNECWFLTLTFDDEHLVSELACTVLETNEGADKLLYSLSNETLQKFWKRYRKYLSHEYPDKYEYIFKGHYDEIGQPQFELRDPLRYFACGEYGSKFFRPHYHAIVYASPLKELHPWEKSKSGHQLYRSPELEKIWKNGIVCVSPVTWDTCAYTARYIMKKRLGIDSKFLWSLGLMPERTWMSRRPGIARNYYDNYKDKIYKFDGINLSSSDGGLKFKPPRYYDSLYETDNPDHYRQIKLNRKEISENNRKLELSRTSVTYEELLKIKEQNAIARTRSLKREVF